MAENAISSRDLARAARVLLLRTRQESAGLFAGNYASAFRGGGVEFEESRPYAPGDDVRTIDWNASARSGDLFVKRFREERDQTLLFALDVSGSMAFGSAPRSQAATAAYALALVAAAASRAGDRMGFVAFDTRIRSQVPIGRRAGHARRIVRAALVASAAAAGPTDLGVGLRALRSAGRRRSTLLLVSDFRDPRLLPGGAQPALLRAALAELARRHEIVALAIVDRRELALPRVGAVRIADPERPGKSFVLDTGSRTARERYLAACALRRRRLEGELRRSGADWLWLRSDRNPLYALGRFFQERAGRRARALLALLALLAAACAEEPVRWAAPAAPLATLVLEPPRVRLGDVAVLELAVITPPGHVPRPFRPPEAPPGFWLLGAERLAAEKQPSRWVHRTRLRLRSRALGRFTWPASAVEVEAPDGSLSTLPVAELPLEVASVAADFPDRVHPFGVRAPPATGGAATQLAAAAAFGALAALATVGLVVLARRRVRVAGVAPATPSPQAEPPWVEARSALAAAGVDPAEGAHRVAAALRRYVARRFRADTVSRTTEELAAAQPPFGASSRWPAFVEILRELDAFRFRPLGEAERRPLGARLGELRARAEAFVEDSVPPESRS